MANWDSSQSEPYEKYGAEHKYDIYSGTFYLPVAVDQANLALGESPVEIVQAHCPYRVRRTEFEAQKSTAPPVIPSPVSQGSFTFIAGTLTFNQPSLTTSLDTFDWRAKGEYEFVETVPHDVSDGFLLMTFPFSVVVQREITEAGFGGGNPPSGAVANAGSYGKAGWELSQNLDFTTGQYNYNIYTYYPGNFFNNEMLNGGTPQTPLILLSDGNPNTFPPDE